MKDQSPYLVTKPAIRIDIQRDSSVDISYFYWWKGKELAMEETHGNWELI